MSTSSTIIVTGASRGLGAAVACWLGKAGASVTLMARNSRQLSRVANAVEALGGHPLVVAGDVSDPTACLQAVEKTRRGFGRIDAVINNAGVFQPLAGVGSADPEQWLYNIKVNLMGPFYMCRAALAELQERNGRVVNVSSGAATRIIEYASAYCSAKSALNHFTRVLAAEEPTVTAVSVRPGVVDTQMQAVIRQQGAEVMSNTQLAYYQDLQAKGELEPPEVPARSIAWLALRAPATFSGDFLDYDDPRIQKPALEFFGESLDTSTS